MEVFARSISQTPAKPSERRSGSDANKEGSAATDSKGAIEFSPEVTTALENKVKEHNEKSSKRVTLTQLKRVYRRGSGAFSTSHRPGMTRGQWSMARVNMFLKMVSGGEVKQSYRAADSDLMKNNLAKASFDGKAVAMAPSNVISAAFQTELSSLETSIVYLPEGRHRISATVGGKPKTVDVEIDSRIGASFAEDLTKRLAQNVRPFAGFDHASGPASFIPVEFRYEDGVGLMLDVEWTEAGRKAIEGRDYSYFSPTFLISTTGIPTGLAQRGEIGSLVNDPAFVEIPRLAASNTEPLMIDQLIELGLVEASQDADTAMDKAKANLASLRESASTAESDEDKAVIAAERYAKLEAEYLAMKEENDKLKQGMVEKAKAAADVAIDEAVKAGRIAPQDDATKSFWHASILANPEALNALNAIPANPVLNGETILASRTETSPQEVQLTGLARVEAAFKAQQSKQ